MSSLETLDGYFIINTELQKSPVPLKCIKLDDIVYCRTNSSGSNNQPSRPLRRTLDDGLRQPTGGVEKATGAQVCPGLALRGVGGDLDFLCSQLELSLGWIHLLTTCKCLARY